MTQYLYTAVNACHITLPVGTINQEFSLYQGEMYDLPEDHATVQRMVAQELLKPVYKTPKIKKNNGS